MDNLLWQSPSEPDSFSDPELDSSFHGTVSVIPAYLDDSGALVELDWEEANDGVFPFGALWVAAFGIDPSTGARLDGDEVAILEPEIGSNTWTLDFSDLGTGPFHVEAVLDELDDGIIGIAEPSALWHQLLTVSGGQVLDPEGAAVDGIGIYITVPWDAPDEGGDATDTPGDGVPSAAEIAEALAEALENATEALGNNENEPDSFVTLTGDAAIDAVSAGDCATMLFSENGYGPYYWTYFSALGLEPGNRAWSVEVLADDGRMQLSGACDCGAEVT